jgi:hypothetical protein
MAKAGQRKNDASGPTSGRNNPKESVDVTAGTPKKRETYEEQAREHKDPGVVAQHAKPEKSTRDHRDPNGLRSDSTGGGRSGSQSNKGSD